jgi:hypothetical protein
MAAVGVMLILIIILIARLFSGSKRPESREWEDIEVSFRFCCSLGMDINLLDVNVIRSSHGWGKERMVT